MPDPERFETRDGICTIELVFEPRDGEPDRTGTMRPDGAPRIESDIGEFSAHVSGIGRIAMPSDGPGPAVPGYRPNNATVTEVNDED